MGRPAEDYFFAFFAFDLSSFLYALFFFCLKKEEKNEKKRMQELSSQQV